MSIYDVVRTVSSFHDSTGKQLKIGGYRPDPKPLVVGLVFGSKLD